MFTFGKRSRSNLAGVHQDLVIVITVALTRTDIDFSVIEGLRTVERQRELVASGASRTMNSRHITGHAVDVAPYVNGSIRWDWPLYRKLGKTVKKAAEDHGIPITWGGEWKTWTDAPHFQLDWRAYPKER